MTWGARKAITSGLLGFVCLLAAVEWLLWLAAFIYCFYKAFRKAGSSKVKLLVICMLTAFIVVRLLFLAVFIVTLPLSTRVFQELQPGVVEFLLWIGFGAISVLLTTPWLLCVYQLMIQRVGQARLNQKLANEHQLPKVIVIMPCYQELSEVLLRTLDSVVDGSYPSACVHIFLSFDRDQQDTSYLDIIEKLGVHSDPNYNFPSSIDVLYRGNRITVSRFLHGGKRHCQKQTYQIINNMYAEYFRRNKNICLLFMDSDCILDFDCMQSLVSEMLTEPRGFPAKTALTGIITATTSKHSLFTLLQDIEYVHGQLFERSVESTCGAVTCLPGALTLVRLCAFQKMAPVYFADKREQCEDLFEYCRCHLGEDRWLTHLFMVSSTHRHEIGMNTGAYCKTEAVRTFKGLLHQRRRWFLGSITNEVCMLTDARLWIKFPLLCAFRFAQNTIRTTSLMFLVTILSLLTMSSEEQNLPTAFLALSLGLNWILMVYFAVELNRYKVMLYPLMFVGSPFLNWLYMVYGVCTAGKRTWGGPRAEAGIADLKGAT